MIEGYGTFATGHVWLGIDPGVTTGVAVLDDDNNVITTMKLGADQVARTLDDLVRSIHRDGATIDVVKEKLARVGGGELAKTLEQVVHDVDETIVDVYDLPVHIVTPGTWKPSRVAKQLRPSLDKTMSVHEKDAACMVAYVKDRGAKPTIEPRRRTREFAGAGVGRPRLEDTPQRIAQRIKDEKRRAIRKEQRRAARADW